jgi:hypothetical protein
MNIGSLYLQRYITKTANVIISGTTRVSEIVQMMSLCSRSVVKMADKKLEEVVDLLAKYGGFNREYLRDKLLTFANDGRSETKNKMAQVAAMFGKKLGEVFPAQSRGCVVSCKFEPEGLWLKPHGGFWALNNPWLQFLLTGEAEIVEE